MLSIGTTAAAGTGQGGSHSASQPRLIRAAHEFEAQMMQELLKPMTSGNGLDGEDGAGSGSGSALATFASEALGKALSERGGFGIASGVVRELSHSGNRPAAAQGTKDLHNNTVMNSFK
jgi:Rod binding domain-containing protein